MKTVKIVILLILLQVATSVAARTSRFTSEGRAPLYWMAYEDCFVNDHALPEGRFQQNIDWVSKNLLPYGYTMVCTDGWIEGAQTVNQNGYIEKYNSGWGHGFDYWVKFAAKKGLKSGVYYNPLWMTRAAYDQNTPVKGTDRHARDIAGPTSFNSFLHWVDTDAPGAEQWIKGYVRHFIDLGFSFLRVDFLNMYENAYGTVRYRRALKWISEEAGDEIMVSIVMPNCWEHAATERRYGDMFRISEDVFGGGFDFVSGRRRGQRYDGWANWGNIFDGFVDFSDIPRAEIMMDGDFVRLNTASTPDEKQFWISLLVMAGSPIAVADQFDTVCDNLQYFQNNNLLSLAKEGFYARPLTSDVHDERSQLWTGTAANGDRIVAAFNREERSVIRRYGIDELGLSDKSWQTDLWTSEVQARPETELQFRLAPHQCKVLRFSANDPSGVDRVVAGDYAEATYYSLDGICMGSEPSRLADGIYIKRQGNSAVKITVRNSMR